MNVTIRPRRLFVSGASRLSVNGAHIWRELGCLLASENGIVVITGGLERRVDDPAGLTADRTIIDGMLPVLRSRGIAAENQIETFLRIRILKNRNAQSRRFSMVHSADVVSSVEGERGTRSVLDVALALERPVLPLPFGGGASRETWEAQRLEIIDWFRFDQSEAEDFERIRLADLDESQLRELAIRVHSCVMRGFTQGCFVIMQFHESSDSVFDEAIQPALAAHGFQAWRTDRSVSTADVLAAIRDGIRHSFFVIADTTDDRPNVMCRPRKVLVSYAYEDED